EALRDDAADDLVDELVALAVGQRLELDVAVAELTAAAGLLLVPALGAGRLADRLQVRDARRVQLHLDAEAPVHALERDLDVHLREPRDDGLAGLLVTVDVERRVLLRQPAQGLE